MEETTATYRVEKDSMGEVRVPAKAYYGAQSQRAVENFPVSGQRMPMPVVHAVALVKGLAAEVNAGLGLLPLALSSAARGSELESPMAIIVVGGLVTSTSLNMIVLPTLYVWLARRKARGSAAP